MTGIDGVQDDLLAIGTSAVMSRAIVLAETLVLPSHLVFTLPPADLRLFDAPSARCGLTQALRLAVRRGVGEWLAARAGPRSSSVAVIGGDELRVSLHEGDEREADARFEPTDGRPVEE